MCVSTTSRPATAIRSATSWAILPEITSPNSRSVGSQPHPPSPSGEYFTRLVSSLQHGSASLTPVRSPQLRPHPVEHDANPPQVCPCGYRAPMPHPNTHKAPPQKATPHSMRNEKGPDLLGLHRPHNARQPAKGHKKRFSGDPQKGFTAKALYNVRQRPSLPRSPPRSTIGAERLNFRVRNGTGCFPHAMVTETLLKYHRTTPHNGMGLPLIFRKPHSGRVTSL